MNESAMNAFENRLRAGLV